MKSHIPTRNPRFNQLIAEIEQVAGRSRAPMLLVGPTGAGKSFLARRMYELKKARHQISGAFVEVNCATLRGDSAASTLFGHKKGRLPAQPPSAPACCAPQTRACSSSTKSASWAPTSRPCC